MIYVQSSFTKIIIQLVNHWPIFYTFITHLIFKVEYLNDKLKKANQKLSEVQGERDALTTTLELAQEQIQSLELKIAQQEEKVCIHYCLY